MNEKFEVGEKVYIVNYHWTGSTREKAEVVKITPKGQIVCEISKGYKKRFMSDGCLIGGNGRIEKVTEETKARYAEYIYMLQCRQMVKKLDSLTSQFYKKYMGKNLDMNVFSRLCQINDELEELIHREEENE